MDNIQRIVSCRLLYRFAEHCGVGFVEAGLRAGTASGAPHLLGSLARSVAVRSSLRLRRVEIARHGALDVRDGSGEVTHSGSSPCVALAKLI